MKLLFIGPPGAGKGTQAALVAARLGIPHISTGEMFRFHVSNGTDLGRQVEAILETGAYVPDEITVAMLAERMRDARHHDRVHPRRFPPHDGNKSPHSTSCLATGVSIGWSYSRSRKTPSWIACWLEAGSMTPRKRSAERFRIYEEQTAPLLDLYKARGLVVDVDGLGEVDEVTERVLEAIAQRRVNQ